ncbi:lipopolysaccharide transport periplasmic protein LptA [Ferrimonas gelatinilytica]|uniref:Lipopolysaccharide export system protein LptA n=1 Tax=Ferrimonas gelatinilytica TaxID=1255257 RepID=A0ABP9SF52_9GAMM
MKCNKLILLGLLALAPQTLASEADFTQPVKVTANSSSGDFTNRVLEYRDNVVIVQGSLRIEADRLILESSEDKSRQVMIATGNPATYEQVMENGLMARAEAREIRYDVNTQLLTMSGNAQLSQADSLVRGETISYNARLQRLTAEGSKDEQITTIFMPKEEKKVEPEPEAPAPAPAQEPQP